MTTDHKPIAQQAAASRTADASLRLAEARAQIEELIEANQRLRQELGEMTLMWVAAELSGHRPSDPRCGPSTGSSGTIVVQAESRAMLP